MVFRQVGNDTDKLINKFGILNKSFANIKMDFQNGQGVRSFGNIVSKQDLVNFEKFQQDLQRGISYHKAFNNNLANSHTYIQQQAVRLRELNIQQKLLDRQLKTNKISQEEYNASMTANKAQITALTTQTQALTFAQKASAVASKFMGTALKTALNIGLMLAINAIISGIMKLVNRQEEAKQKAEELRQKTIENAEAAKEELNKISDLISQYEKFKDVTSLTADDKETLKSIQDQLIETFGKEAEGIDLVNGKYDEQIQKIRAASEEKLKNYEISAEEAYKTVKQDSDNNKSQIFRGNAYYTDDSYFDLNRRVYVNGKSVENTGLINALNNIEGVKYDSFGNGIIDVDAVGKTASELSDIYLNIIEALKKFSDSEFDFTQTDIYKDIVANYQHYSEEAEATYDAAESLIESKLRLYELSNGTYKELGRDEYLQWIEGFKSQFDSNDKDIVQALEDKISQINIEVGEYISSQSTNDLEIFHNFTNFLNNSENGLKSYSETIGDIVSSQEEYSSIIEQQTKDGKLSSENIKKLVKDGKTSILVYDDTVKGYKASVSELNKISQETASQELSKLKQQKQELLLNYNNSKAQLENLRKNIRSEADINLYSRELNRINSEYKETNALLDMYISLIEYADEGTSEYADSISKVNEELERQKTEIEKLDSGQSTIDKAIEEQKEFGHLSASSIKALHEAGLGTALAYNEATGETTLLIDSVEELYKAMIKAQEEAAKISLNNLATEIEEIENRLNNFSVNSEGDAKKKAELENNLAEKQSQYDTQQQNIQVISSYKFSFNSDDAQKSAEEAVEEYTNSIKEAFDKEKSDLDHLLNMDVISQEEYYNRLFDLNEKYFKGKTELLDEYRQYEEEVYKGLKETQIKAIQEQIDALKSVNEEKQEEIDLEKAKQALENAKRNKTISVYDSERGWIRETDRNAIDSAQKEYDDLVLNEKVEALENLIDAIENGTNTNHNLDESINAVEQANSITGQQFIENVMQSFANKGLDFNSMFNTNGLTNGTDVYNSIMQGKITPVSSDSYTTNNSSITLNGVTVMANNPEEFIAQMEDIANERFKENFPAAMNQFGRDLKRYQMNHSF